MVKIIAMVVVKNEAHRYLSAFIEWTKTFTDEIAIYDDRSTDGSVDIALRKGCLTAVRFPDDPSFLEHEGRFRENAWRWMSTATGATEGDWVFSLDADEFFVDERGERQGLEADIVGIPADASLSFGIPEIFDQVEGDGIAALYQRVDGWWGAIRGQRLAPWTSGATFPDRSMGCGSVPMGSRSGLEFRGSGSILHFGYLDPEDRLAKYRRYQELPGHSSKHIESIVQEPKLELWQGPLPFRT